MLELSSMRRINASCPSMRMKKQKKRNNAGIVVGRPFERLGALGTGAVFPGLCARRHVDRRSDTRRAHHALRYGHEKQKLTIKPTNRFLVTIGVVMVGSVTTMISIAIFDRIEIFREISSSKKRR